MLAPNDVDTTEQSLGRALQASSAVTVYAAAMRFQVSPLLQLSLPAWFDPIKVSLETAIGHARNWQDNLCGAVAGDVPQGFIDYNAVFQPVANELINLITTIELSGQSATSDQHQQASALLQRLLSHLERQATTMSTLHGSLVQLMDNVQDDHTVMVEAGVTVAREVPGGGIISKQIQADLGNDFLDTTFESPCLVSISIKSSIDITIQQTAGSHPELLPYVIAMQVLQKAQGDNEVATSALSDVLNQWQFLQDLLQDVVTDLDKAADPDVLPILQKLDVQIAQGIWTQLQAFAEQLINGQGS